MNDCERLQPELSAYIAGELDERRLGPLLLHARDCATCRDLLELHRDLSQLAGEGMVPEEDEFTAMRDRVLRSSGAARPGGDRVAVPLRAVAAVAVAALLFAAGLGVGLTLPAGNGDDVTDRLIRAATADAATNRSLPDVADSPFTYSNASFRRLDGGRVALDFDLTTHVSLIEPEDSGLLREVAVHAMLDPASTGTRLKAMTLAAAEMEPKVRDALLVAMRHDDNLAVRLKALELLSDHLDDPRIEAGVLATLRDDEAVQMRLLALDYLAAHGSDARRLDRLHEAIGSADRPGDGALVVRLARYRDDL